MTASGRNLIESEFIRNERVARGGSLVDNLDGVQRVAELKALDAENRFEFGTVQRRRHHRDTRPFGSIVTKAM